MGLVGASFIPLGRILGRLLDEHPRPILAYSLNVAGSLVGTWLLVALSLLHLSPAWWFACVALLALPFVSRGAGRLGEGLLLIGLVTGAAIASHAPQALESLWSPYQKLVLEEQPEDEIGEYIIHVNNIGYQAILDLDRARVEADPKHYAEAWRGLGPYDVPLLLHPKARRVLIVGAGSGNDVAAALRAGAEEVVAVEIDPVIIDLGRRYHPERPYDDPRVRVVVDDARSFFATSDERFDLIVFGLLDSHTTTSMTNARLDHYVYTKESLTQARSLLTEGGVVVMSFAIQRQFIGDRMARTLHEVFGDKPLSFVVPVSAYGWGGTVFVSGDLGQVREALEANARLANAIGSWQRANPRRWSYSVRPSTDDWPYLYLPHPKIPLLYLLLAGLMLVLFRAGAKLCGTPGLVVGWRRTHWHFFFLGAAFLLLEVQNISKASLILGNTWWVNSVIISGVLVMVLLANAVAARFARIPMAPVYAGLLGSCLGLYFFDMHSLSALPYASKALVVGGLTTLPMFFAGIVFVHSFAVAEHKDEALGANLGGALVGGLVQTVTFVTGVKLLLLLVAGFYALVFLTRPAAEPAPPKP
jgi:spermidine synthase